MVMSVNLSGSPSVSHSLLHFSPTCFDIALKFCIFLSWVELIGVLRHMQRYFSHICDGTDNYAGGLKKKLDLRSGSQRHRHFVRFFNVPVQAPTRDHPFIRWLRHTAPISRLLRSHWDTEDTFSTKTPGPSRGTANKEATTSIRNWTFLPLG